MAKPIGMRTHSMGIGKNKLAFDNLAIITDDSCAPADATSPTTPDHPAPGPTPKGRKWEKYAVDQDDKPGTGRKVAKCFGIIFMMVFLFSLTASLVIKDKADAKRMHDFDERMKHTTHFPPSNITKPASPSAVTPSSSPAAATTNLTATTPVVSAEDGVDGQK